MSQKKKINRKEIIIEEVENLFQFVPAKQLRKTLHEVYSVYLQNVETIEFRQIAMDMYLLNKFLEKAEENNI